MASEITAASTGAAPAAAAPSRRRQQTRERLFEAALEVFVEEGLRGASVEAICARAGFTRGAFYSNFASKEELFLALLRQEMEERARDVEAKIGELAPILRERADCMQPGEVAEYVARFFEPKGDATAWFMLETEFSLLAMRDPDAAPGFAEFMNGLYPAMGQAVEAAIAAAGRRFTLPVDRALLLLGGVYERALRVSAIGGGHDAPGGLAELPGQVAELLFVVTTPLGE